jgi:hypothetical protein
MASPSTAAVGSPHLQGRRRASTRRSSGALPPALDSPRTSMPRDDNAFTFRREHLDDWSMPDSLWIMLPAELKTKVKNLQHSGAAVQTSFARLEELAHDLPEVIHEDEETDKDKSMTSLAGKTSQDFIDLNAKLVQVQYQRRASETSRMEEKFDCSPIPPEYRATSGIETASTSFSSEMTTRTNSTSCPSPFDLSHPHSPEPMSPTPLDLGTTSRRNSNATSNMTAPPRNAPLGHYLAQLHHLRTEDVVRLRHAMYAVETELLVLSKPLSPTSSLESTAINTTQTHMSDINAAFEDWWPEKKALAISLDQKSKSIEPGLKFRIGWGEGAYNEV